MCAQDLPSLRGNIWSGEGAVSYIYKLLRVAGVSMALSGVAGGAEPRQPKGSAMVPDAAKALHEKGREAGQRGKAKALLAKKV